MDAFMNRKLAFALALLTLTFVTGRLQAERVSRSETPLEPARQVEFFAAIEAGELEVTFIPADATVANVLIKNKTDRPLSIKLPETFAGVPVLAQFGGMGGMGGMGGGGMGGMGQGMGGGMGGMGGMGGGGMGGMGGMGGGGGGFFSVPPAKTSKIKVPCVCLEHGKPDPTPRMSYRIIPLEKFNANPQVAEICRMLGRGEVPQNAAQAATWRLTDGLSWQELANKNRVELRSVGYAERFFRPQELMLAVRIQEEAARRARERSEAAQQTPVSSLSSNDQTEAQ